MQTIEQRAERSLDKRFRRVCKYLPLAAQQGLRNPRSVHQLRVASRRAIAALELYGPILPPKRSRRLRRKIRDVRRAAGRARDLDVFLEWLRDAGPRYQALIPHLLQERAEAQRPLRKVARRLGKTSKQTPLHRSCTRVLARLDRKRAPKGDRKREFPNWTRQTLQSTIHRFHSDACGPLGDLEHLHELRISAKHLRYQLELLRPMLAGSWAEPALDELKDLQKEIGLVHDRSQSVDWLSGWHDQETVPQQKALVGELLSLERNSLEQCQRAFVATWVKSGRSELLTKLGKLSA